MRTAASFVRSAVLSVAAGSDRESVENAVKALSSAARPRVRVEVPVSTVGMEYVAHRKPPKMLEWIAEAVSRRLGRVAHGATDRMRERQRRVHADLANPDFLRESFGA